MFKFLHKNQNIHMLLLPYALAYKSGPTANNIVPYLLSHNVLADKGLCCLLYFSSKQIAQIQICCWIIWWHIWVCTVYSWTYKWIQTVCLLCTGVLNISSLCNLCVIKIRRGLWNWLLLAGVLFKCVSLYLKCHTEFHMFFLTCYSQF